MQSRKMAQTGGLEGGIEREWTIDPANPPRFVPHLFNEDTNAAALLAKKLLRGIHPRIIANDGVTVPERNFYNGMVHYLRGHLPEAVMVLTKVDNKRDPRENDSTLVAMANLYAAYARQGR